MGISIAAGPDHPGVKDELLAFLTEESRFEAGSLPKSFDTEQSLKHVVALFRTRKGDYGLVTRYKKIAVIELGGRVGIAPIPIEAKPKTPKLALALAKERPAPSQATSVVIVKESPHSQQGLGYPTAISVTDKETIDKLAAMFPGHHRSPSGEVAGGWEAGYRVYFNYPKGRTVRVTVSRNDGGKTWSRGAGDHATKGDFKGLISRIGPLTKGVEKRNGR